MTKKNKQELKESNEKFIKVLNNENNKVVKDIYDNVKDVL